MKLKIIDIYILYCLEKFHCMLICMSIVFNFMLFGENWPNKRLATPLGYPSVRETLHPPLGISDLEQ